MRVGKICAICLGGEGSVVNVVLGRVIVGAGLDIKPGRERGGWGGGGKKYVGGGGERRK